MNSSYPVTLADLVEIADAACELDVTKQFYIDRPDEQQRLTAIVNRLHDIVERAAGAQAAIYAPDDGSEKRRNTGAAA